MSGSGTPRERNWAAGLAEWRALLGTGRVDGTAHGLAEAGRCTFPGAPPPVCVLWPADRAEVAACLRIAHRWSLRVHPVSTGRNWGYGSACPPSSPAALMRLAGLDRIVDWDDRLGLVTVEPGVTFGALAAFLSARGSRWWPPATGAGPDVSVLGNALQRGLGRGPYRTIADTTAGLEAVLADGRTVRLAGGPGPSAQGFFLQGGPGVVTALTLALEPAPEYHQHVLFRVRQGGEGTLARAVDAARELLRRHGAGLTVDLLNRHRTGAGAGERSRPPDVLTGAWSGLAEIWADGPDALAMLRDRLLSGLSAAAGHWQLDPPGRGVPAPAGRDGLACAYRYKEGGLPDGVRPDPDRDGCGVLWFAPTIPMTGEEAARTVTLIERTVSAHGLEPSMSLRLGRRLLHCVTGLFWDRADEATESAATACHRRLEDLCGRLGVHPYRPVLGRLPQGAVHPGTRRLLTELTGALDPNGVLTVTTYGTYGEEAR
ncbi:4-cresol dehydrogenase [Streptomyces mashuensis]|uniref:4-cresol dehydrogenase n=1 Tax=Streptomyces mashuensis TaxID=33904 RepID=A0A919B555_9ACTN|nr:FAD-binding protein [Streptomyces mashuensis]GHF52894.1 4-cresol dehydrogenase [Streptomyces mashuensis]